MKMDNVCNGGPEIAVALGTAVTAAQLERCAAACGAGPVNVCGAVPGASYTYTYLSRVFI